MVTAFLEAFFGTWVAYGYTTGLKADLDRVASGALAWKAMLGGSWSGFHEALEDVGALDARV